MQLSEIRNYIKSLAENDLSISNADIERWINSGIDRINMALQCAIPKVTGKNDAYIPEFDERFHESLVLFGNAKYRESDADFSSAQYFMATFNDMLMQMQRDMELKPSTRRDFNVQQIVVSDVSILNYKLTMPYGSYFDTIKVYKNDVEIDAINFRINLTNREIIFQGIALVVNDKITIVFENNSDLNEPPYSWWTF